MRILFDLQHPAHLHFFRNVIDRLSKDGHEVMITGRHKDILVELAQKFGLEMEVFGCARKGVLNLGRELLYRQWRLWRIVKSFRPDLMMAIAGTYISFVGKVVGIPTYVFYDTEHATLSNLLSYPFATCIYVPNCYRKNIRWRHCRYNGYHELAYLHPRYFRPDSSVLHEEGLREGEIFSILRFVAWEAAHDIGRRGLTYKNKIRAVEALREFGRVLISCEGTLPSELEEFRLNLDVSRVHHLMAHAALIFGESATMCSEGAVLGVPGVYIDPVGRGYTDEQESEYGLVFNFTPQQQDRAISQAKTILKGYDYAKWREQGRRLVEQKIDVTNMVYCLAVERPFA